MTVAVFNDTSVDDGHFGCQLVMSHLLAQLERAGLETVFKWPVGEDWRNQRDRLPAPGTIDAIIVNGEGSMHSCLTRDRPNVLADVPALAHEHYGVPAILLNATLYNNTPEFYARVAGFDAIYVRDTASLAQLAEHSVAAAVVPDLTVSLPGPAPVRRRAGIGTTDSVMSGVEAGLKRFAARTGCDHFPMTQSRRMAGHPPDLRVRRSENAADFIEWLCSKELVITGRYHTVTLCLRTRTPFLAFESNTPKISWLVKDAFGETTRVLGSVDDLDVTDLAAAGRFTGIEAAQLDACVEQAAARTGEMFRQVAARVRQSRPDAQSGPSWLTRLVSLRSRPWRRRS